MKGAMAEAEAEKLREKPEIEKVNLTSNHRGPVIEVKPTDRVAKDAIYDEVEDFQTWIEVLDPYE